MRRSLGGHLTLEDGDKATVVRFNDCKIVEESQIEGIGHELAGLVESQPGLKLVLDFAGVAQLSSGALGMLVTVLNESKKNSGHVRISNISPQISEVFKITRLDRYFEVFDSTAAAMRKFG